MRKVKFTFKSPSVPCQGKMGCSEYTKMLWINNRTSIRQIALRALREAAEKNSNFYFPESNSPIEINLAQYTKETQRYGIKYKMNEKGTIRFLENYDPLQEDWSYGELRKLHRHDYVDGDIKHIIIQQVDGLGSFSDVMGLAAAVELIVEFIFGGSTMSFEKQITEPQSSIVQNWSQNNLHSLRQIRIFLDEKSIWKTNEVATRLRITNEESAILLDKLGYIFSNGGWRLGDSEESLRKRDEWMQNEKAEEERIRRERERDMHFM